MSQQRRDILKKIGASATTATLISSMGVSATSTPAYSCSDIDNSSKCWQSRDEDGVLRGGKIFQSSTLAYYGSEYIDTRDIWYHDFRLSTAGNMMICSNAGCTGDPEPTPGIHYQGYEISPSTEVNINLDNGDPDYFGVYPADTSSRVYPTVAKELTQATVGALNPAAGFAIAAGNIYKELANTDDPNDASSGARMEKRHLSWFPGAGEDSVMHYQRFVAELESGSRYIDRGTFSAESRVHNSASRWNTPTRDTSVNFSVSLLNGDARQMMNEMSAGDISKQTKSELNLEKRDEPKIAPKNEIELHDDTTVYYTDQFPVEVTIE